MTTKLIFSFLTLISFLGCSSDTSHIVKKESLSHLEMSSSVLKLIPDSPSYVPNKQQQDSAISLLTVLYKNNQIGVTTTDTIEFVDQGENFESVSCNLCGQSIDIEIWQTSMEKAYEKQFEDLAFTTPCCDRPTSLNALSYHWPAGFAKFVITVAEAENEVNPKDLENLQLVLGTKLKSIWAHY